MANMEERLSETVNQAGLDARIWHQIIHGNDHTYVETENGLVSTVSKQLKDVHDEVVNGVVDYLNECKNARDVSLETKNETIQIKIDTNSIKEDVIGLKNDTQSIKNQAQNIYDQISTATNTSIESVKTEGTNQIALVKNAVAEQVSEATSQANRAENATSSKANLDFSNINPTANAIKQIINWVAPNWSKRQVLALNTNITISQYGWILMRNTAYTDNLYGYINGYQVFRQYGNYSHWEEWNSLSFLVGPGDVVKLTGGELTFMPCKGA